MIKNIIKIMIFVPLLIGCKKFEIVESYGNKSDVELKINYKWNCSKGEKPDEAYLFISRLQNTYHTYFVTDTNGVFLDEQPYSEKDNLGVKAEDDGNEQIPDDPLRDGSCHGIVADVPVACEHPDNGDHRLPDGCGHRSDLPDGGEPPGGTGHPQHLRQDHGRVQHTAESGSVPLLVPVCGADGVRVRYQDNIPSVGGAGTRRHRSLPRLLPAQRKGHGFPFAFMMRPDGTAGSPTPGSARCLPRLPV